MQAGREIKFRGKRLDKGEWVYGYPWIVPQINLHYILTGKLDLTSVGLVEKYEVVPGSIGQYTGVHDDQDMGEELYDGDIVEVSYEGHVHICAVKYEGGSPMFAADSLPDGFLWFSEILECDSGHWWVEGTKKIGSIDENPDLLPAT